MGAMDYGRKGYTWLMPGSFDKEKDEYVSPELQSSDCQVKTGIICTEWKESKQETGSENTGSV